MYTTQRKQSRLAGYNQWNGTSLFYIDQDFVKCDASKCDPGQKEAERCQWIVEFVGK